MIDKLTNSTEAESDIYDKEWAKLVIEAKQSGLTIDEVRMFLQKDEYFTSIKSNFQHH